MTGIVLRSMASALRHFGKIRQRNLAEQRLTLKAAIYEIDPFGSDFLLVFRSITHLRESGIPVVLISDKPYESGFADYRATIKDVLAAFHRFLGRTNGARDAILKELYVIAQEQENVFDAHLDDDVNPRQRYDRITGQGIERAYHFLGRRGIIHDAQGSIVRVTTENFPALARRLETAKA
jgi:hypothetical protein